MNFRFLHLVHCYVFTSMALLCVFFSSSILFAKAYPISTPKKKSSLQAKKISGKKKIRKRVRRRKVKVSRRKVRGLQSSALRLSNTDVPVSFTKTYSKFFGIPCVQEAAFEDSFKEWIEPDTKPFTEFVPSWNALRPTRGSFIFKASIKTIRGWTPWYRFAEWKCDEQLTFFNNRACDVHVKHVRLEMQKNMMGHGFRIRVEAKNGADISNIHALFGCVSNLSQYKINHGIASLPSLVLKGVPRQSQMVLDHPRYKDICCPTSMAMIVRYFNMKYDGIIPKPLHKEAVDFANLSHDKAINIHGSWALNVAQAYDAAKGRVHFRIERLNSFKDLHEYLRKEIPVSVSVRGLLRGGAKTYGNGHYMVVIGWNADKQTVLCIDPAFGASKRTLRAYDARHFLAAWSRSHNMAYVALPRQEFREEVSS